MGNDYYSVPSNGNGHADEVPIGVGAGTVIDGAIIDKNCRNIATGVEW